MKFVLKTDLGTLGFFLILIIYNYLRSMRSIMLSVGWFYYVRRVQMHLLRSIRRFLWVTKITLILSVVLMFQSHRCWGIRRILSNIYKSTVILKRPCLSGKRPCMKERFTRRATHGWWRNLLILLLLWSKFNYCGVVKHGELIHSQTEALVKNLKRNVRRVLFLLSLPLLTYMYISRSKAFSR